MQMLQDLPVGLEYSSLVVREGVFSTEILDNRLRFSQLVPGQSWKQVMFDLVVEAAIPEVGDRMSADVPAGQYLTVQEVQLALPLQHGHGFVVGREDRVHLHAKEPAMDGDEHQRLQMF